MELFFIIRPYLTFLKLELAKATLKSEDKDSETTAAAGGYRSSHAGKDFQKGPLSILRSGSHFGFQKQQLFLSKYCNIKHCMISTYKKQEEDKLINSISKVSGTEKLHCILQ